MAPKKDTPAQRDECVNYAMEVLWGEFDQYLKDKFIFPQIVSHAVARTMAGMVHMVSVGMPRYMKSWDDPSVEGRRPEEWLSPKEPVLAPLDTWARCILPVKKPLPPPPPLAVDEAALTPAQEPQQQQPEQPPSPPTSATGRKSLKPAAATTTKPTPAAEPPKEKEQRPRRATLTLTPGQPLVAPSDSPPVPKLYDRKGSPVRRFSEGTVLPPETIQKFKPPEPERKPSARKSRIGSMAAAAASASGEPRKSLAPRSSVSSVTGDPSKPKPTTRRSSVK